MNTRDSQSQKYWQLWDYSVPWYC